MAAIVKNIECWCNRMDGQSSLTSHHRSRHLHIHLFILIHSGKFYCTF